MLQTIKDKNENFKELKLKLRQSPRQTYIEIDNILSNVQDKRAFVFLMDAHETEKEITRDILESLLENTIEINNDIISILETSGHKKLSDIINDVFNPKNAKSLIIAAITLGLILSIVFNESVAIKVFDAIKPTIEKKE